jgi:hypothetical protein
MVVMPKIEKVTLAAPYRCDGKKGSTHENGYRSFYAAASLVGPLTIFIPIFSCLVHVSFFSLSKQILFTELEPTHELAVLLNY